MIYTSLDFLGQMMEVMEVESKAEVTETSNNMIFVIYCYKFSQNVYIYFLQVQIIEAISKNKWKRLDVSPNWVYFTWITHGVKGHSPHYIA